MLRSLLITGSLLIASQALAVKEYEHKYEVRLKGQLIATIVVPQKEKHSFHGIERLTNGLIRYSIFTSPTKDDQVHLQGGIILDLKDGSQQEMKFEYKGPLFDSKEFPIQKVDPSNPLSVILHTKKK